ncbi:MAG: hypothetical protein F8N37_01955 [Telmatospirillum sp.]|nr:hypothetical protein [Telmatospirillum sp.]
MTAWVVTAVLALIGNLIGFHLSIIEALPGMGIILAATILGYGLSRLFRSAIPVVCWVSLAGMLATCPGVPFAAETQRLTAQVNVLALITPILAFAGLSIAKDLPAFRRLGWPIIVTSFMANAGTFLGATLIAQFFRH